MLCQPSRMHNVISVYIYIKGHNSTNLLLVYQASPTHSHHSPTIALHTHTDLTEQVIVSGLPHCSWTQLPSMQIVVSRLLPSTAWRIEMCAMNSRSKASPPSGDMDSVGRNAMKSSHPCFSIIPTIIHHHLYI